MTSLSDDAELPVTTPGGVDLQLPTNTCSGRPRDLTPEHTPEQATKKRAGRKRKQVSEDTPCRK